MKKTAYPIALSASELLGTEVRNLEGEHIGKIEELVLDIETGKISYVVMSLGGFLGRAGKLFAIPWHALALDADNKKMILNVDKEKLKHAPGFDKDHWPDFVDQDWGVNIYEYYGYRPHWEKD